MNLISCEKLEKSMVEIQFSIDADTFKMRSRPLSSAKAKSMPSPVSAKAKRRAI